MMPDFDRAMTPDPEQYAPATGVTPTQIEESGKRLAKIVKTGTIKEFAAAEREHQALIERQNDELRKIYLQRQFAGLMPKT